jgi:hypothetical protein
MLSGAIDIAIGILFLTGVIDVKGSRTLVFIICLAVGLLYFSLGIFLAVIQLKKQVK